MKHLLRIACAAALLLALLASAALASDLPLTGTAFVKNPDPTDRLNLRAQPKQDAISLGKYYSNTPVELTGEKKNGYVEVYISPLHGWMDEKYLAAFEDSSVSLPTTKLLKDGVNLRESPSYDADVLSTWDKGLEVKVLAVRSDGWLHVKVGAVNGFMREELLSGTFSFHKDTSGSQRTGGDFAVVNNPNPSDRLNLREAPKGDARVLGKYYNGTSVALLEAPKDGWVRVAIGGTAKGYMQTKYLAMNGEEVASAELHPTIKNSSGTGLNLRETASSSAKSLGLYRNGTQVTVMGIYGGWAHVLVDNKIGYMQADKFDSDLGLTYEPMGKEK